MGSFLEASIKKCLTAVNTTPKSNLDVSPNTTTTPPPLVPNHAPVKFPPPISPNTSGTTRTTRTKISVSKSVLSSTTGNGATVIKYASLVQVAVSFKAKCTFSFRDEGATRTLRIVDDTGYTHGELDINIHAGTPCVCAVPRKEKIAVKDKVIRCPQKLSSRKPGNCA